MGTNGLRLFLIKRFHQKDIAFGAVDSVISKITGSRLMGFSYQKLPFCEVFN